MRAGRGAERAAAVVIAGAAVWLLAMAVDGSLVPWLLAEGEHERGDAAMGLVFFGIPMAAAGTVALIIGVALWRGAAGARSAAWRVVVGGVLTGLVIRRSGYIDALWALVTSVTAPGRLVVAWPRLYDNVYAPGGPGYAPDTIGGPPMSGWPSAPIVTLEFWWPVVAIAAAVVVGVLLLVSRPPRQAAPEPGEAPEPSAPPAPGERHAPSARRLRLVRRTPPRPPTVRPSA